MSDETAEFLEFVETKQVMNLKVPWTERPKVKFVPQSLTRIQEFLAKWKAEDVIGNLGDVLKQLSSLKSNFMEALVVEDEQTEECITKLNQVFGVLLSEDNGLVRGIATTCETLWEVLKSGNKACVVFAGKRETLASVFELLVNLFKDFRDSELLTAAQLCLLSLLHNPLTWKQCVEVLVSEGEDGLILLETLRGICHDVEQPIPTLVLERMLLTTCWTGFCQTAIYLKEAYQEVASEGGLEETLLTDLFESWNYFSSAYSQLQKVLGSLKVESVFNTSAVYAVLEECDILASVNLLLCLNVENRPLGPPLPLLFLDQLLNQEYGILYLLRSGKVLANLEVLTKLSNIDQVQHPHYFDDSLMPLAGDIFTGIMNGLKALRFCDKLAGYRSKPHHAFRDPLAMSFLKSLEKDSLRRNFSRFMEKKYIYTLLDILASPPSESSTTTYLQVALFLLEMVAENATDSTFWSENYKSLFLVLKRSHLKDFKELSAKDHTTLSVFTWKSFKEEPVSERVVSAFETAAARMPITPLNKAHVTSLHLMEAMLLVEHSRYKTQLQHEMFGVKLESDIESKIKDALPSALALFQSGMAASAPEQEILLRFALPSQRVLGVLIDLTKEDEDSFISPGHVENILGLWTLTLDLNGQTEGELATMVKREIVGFLKPRLYRKINDQTMLHLLIDKGTSIPLYFPTFLELLLALLPEQLPLLLTGNDDQNIGKMLKAHSAEVQQILEGFNWSESLSELFLCTTPYVRNLVEGLLTRIASYQNDHFIKAAVTCIWNVLKPLIGEGTSSGLAVEMNSFTGLCLLPGVCSASIDIIATPEESETFNQLLAIFAEPSKDSEAHTIFQCSLLDLVFLLLNSSSSSKLLSGEEETRGLGAKMVKTLLEVAVDSRQAVETVNKTTETLKELAEESRVANPLICKLLPGSSLYHIFSRSEEEPDPSFVSAVLSTARLVSNISGDNAGLVRSLVFDPADTVAQQGLEILVAAMDIPEADNEDLALLKTLLKLAKEGGAINSRSIPPPIPKTFSKEATTSEPNYRILDSVLDVSIAKRKRLAKTEAREDDLEILGDELTQLVLQCLGDESEVDLSKLLSSGFKKQTPLKAPEQVKWV